ncbi:26S proteasome non-ATPase regulatory subunit 2 homolog A-like [Miscanthus floridulus]|uniref:26S proteasome non-ATPase regulatory subunit 2 homolog A-like n=1 Tax=Miscanthus floridulus TaxID=154761 RepID=UPI003457FF33
MCLPRWKFLKCTCPCSLRMRQEIRSATSSMTSVLKPLKFLFSYFGTLKSYFETIPEYDLKKCVYTLDHPASESLKYRLLGSEGDMGSWEHEYVRTHHFSCLLTIHALMEPKRVMTAFGASLVGRCSDRLVRRIVVKVVAM